MRASPHHCESDSTMKRGRRHISTFNVVIVVPSITSILAFSASWGMAGLIIGAMTLANCAAIYEWLRLTERCFFLNQYFMRIVTAWIGVFLVVVFIDGPNRMARWGLIVANTLEEGLAWLAVGWMAGWLAVSLCNSAMETEPRAEPKWTPAPPGLGEAGKSSAEKQNPGGGGECCDCSVIQTAIRFLEAATTDPLMTAMEYVHAQPCVYSMWWLRSHL